MELTQLKYFKVLAETENLTKTAENYICQPLRSAAASTVWNMS